MQKSSKVIRQILACVAAAVGFLTASCVSPSSKNLQAVSAGTSGPAALQARQLEQFDRPERDPAFRRTNAPVITFRITGEDVYETQVTLFRSQTEIKALVITARGELVQHSSFSSAERPQLRPLFESFSKVCISAIVDNTLYMPATTIEVWVTGVIDETYVKTSLPSESAESVAYWGERNTRNAALIRWVQEVTSSLSIKYRRLT